MCSIYDVDDPATWKPLVFDLRCRRLFHWFRRATTELTPLIFDLANHPDGMFASVLRRSCSVVKKTAEHAKHDETHWSRNKFSVVVSRAVVRIWGWGFRRRTVLHCTLHCFTGCAEWGRARLSASPPSCCASPFGQCFIFVGRCQSLLPRKSKVLLGARL